MSQLSAVIITYNEADFIGSCLGSIQGIADEIIVVDSFSSDSTKEICKLFNVRFVEHVFEGYIEQKNWGLTLATHKWILSLDADEALSEELRRSILEAKKDLKFDGYYFNRRNNYCGKWLRFSGWYPDRHLRLFESARGRWAGLNPHDKFRLDKGCRTGRLKGDLLHWNFLSYEEHLEKMNRFSSIAASSYFNAGKRSGQLTASIHMAWSFFRSFILRAGFLDGYHGYKICSISAYGCYMKYYKLRMLIRERSNGK
ncbi:MAG: glycosyltransferase family 2 protein [Bacteroidales bacterium]|jgi:glycosyltransferase involved in cell wall biosynthesis